MLLKKETFEKTYELLADAIDGSITFKNEEEFEKYMAPTKDENVKNLRNFVNGWICLEGFKDIRLLFDSKLFFDQDSGAKTIKEQKIGATIFNLHKYSPIKILDFMEFYAEMVRVNNYTGYLEEIQKIFETCLKNNDFPLHRVKKILNKKGRVNLRIICDDALANGCELVIYYDIVHIKDDIVKIENLKLIRVPCGCIADFYWGEYIINDEEEEKEQ